MKTYIILLRGVNVGGKNLLPMKELSTALESDGFKNVKTYIQSGNIVLKSDKRPENKIAALIQQNFGFTPEVLTLSEEEFKSAISNNPYKEYEGKFVHSYFCKETPKQNTSKLESLVSDTERYKIIDKVFYLHAPDGIGRSKLVAKIEDCLGVPATGRNLNTVNKLEEIINQLEQD
jgi:uncharacterized protein (DUF1697 family)